MVDKTNPTENNISNFLPRYYRSDANKKFLQATVEQLVKPGKVKKVNGYLGRRNAKASTGNDIFVASPTQVREQYQLEPSITINDKFGTTEFFKDYQDYINQLGVFGSNTGNHSRLNKQEFYSWNPHIDWDKFVNFQQYYWLPYGPESIKIYGQQRAITSTYSVKWESELGSKEYIFTPNGVSRNPTIKLFRGQTYHFDINSPGEPFSLKFARSPSKLDRYVAHQAVSDFAVEVGTVTFTVPDDCPDVLFYVSENDINLGGVIEVFDIKDNTEIDVEADIVGKKTYKLPTGLHLSNGMKVQFGGNVVPEIYATGAFYVEGVGSEIKLIPEAALELIYPYTDEVSVLFDDGQFDNLPFGSATAYAGKLDYIVINRGSRDKNPWSRYNRWFHQDVINAGAKYNGSIASLDQNTRAVRPIIEFEADLKLFNFGLEAGPDVDLLDDFTQDVFSTIEGSIGYSVDGIPLVEGHKVLFTADTDQRVVGKTYRVTFITVQDSIKETRSRQIHLVPISEPAKDQVVVVKQGQLHQGTMYWYTGTVWKSAQNKTSLNQTPLFDVVDSEGYSFGDTSVYDGSTFEGTKLFSYKEGTGTIDANLGFALSYKNINNTGDIVFNFNAITDTFQYKSIEKILQKNISVGYFVKSLTNNQIAYLNGWQVSTVTNYQPAIRIYKNSNKVNNFDLDIFDNKSNLTDLEVRIYINGIRLDKTQWSIVDGAVYKKIILNTDIALTDVLTIKAFALQPINQNGYYEVPINLQNNPLNNTMGDFTLGEVIDHVNSIVDNCQLFSGSFPGRNNLRDIGNLSALGTKFVQHSGPFSLSMYHVTSTNNNIVKAIEEAREKYGQFKRTFITVAQTIGVDTDTKSFVDLILQEINKDKPKTAPYYFSDLVPYGSASRNDFTVIDYRILTYPLSALFDVNYLSNKAVGVYLNSVQLIYGIDYVFDSQGFVKIIAQLTTGDTVTIYEYDNTDGCFVPPTPTKLGIWPKFEPKIYIDTTLVTPRKMIQGHDGSQVLAYSDPDQPNDYRDELLLELEKRIFNNIKVEYDPAIFDILDVVPGYNRSNDYSLDEFNEVLAPSFYKWTSLIDKDFTKPLSFDRNNPLTFNYRGHSAPDGRETPGYWRGIYRWLLDTDRPNICPWEMLGFSIEPAWWQSVYGPAPYTSDNKILWNDLSEGIIREPNQPIVRNTKCVRPFLKDSIPVDEFGNIQSPLLSNLATGIITASTNGDYVFGDVSPIEAAWRRSSYFPFSILLASMLLTPAKTFGSLIDRSRIVRNLTGQLIYKDTGLRVRPQDVVLPNIYSSSTRTQTAGIINYLVDYILSDNLKSYDQYVYDLENIDFKISYRIGGFTSKEKFNLLLDSKNPTAVGGVFVPQENYNIILNSSSPVKKITYSGVIITKLQDGYEVKGYSKIQPYFKYYAWTQSGSTFNVGGISETFVTWQANERYVLGKIVKYNTQFYRTTATHISNDTFNADAFQKLPSLPVIGGQNAILRKRWDRTEEIVVPYGTKFRDVQSVVDFLLGYGEWLKDQGFVFDDFNNALAQISNWETSAKEFMFWTTQNWSSGQDKWADWDPDNAVPYGSIVRYNGDYYRALRGLAANPIFHEEYYTKLDGLSTVGSSVISLSPSAGKITITTDYTVVDDILNLFNGYEIFGVDGTKIEPNFLDSYRKDNLTSYTPRGDIGVFGATFFLVQKEHVLILDNTTLFNDTIYNPESGYRQERIKTSSYVSTEWYGGFDVPGFIFDQAKTQEWSAWTDYALGDIVKYKEFFYSANSSVVGTSEFDDAMWIKLSKEPTARLLPNWSYKAAQFEDFYSLDSGNFDVGQQKMAQHLIGYQKRQYLENIIQDDVSEFKFYQGMIIEKGTQNVLTKLFDVLSAEGEESLKFFEEWAVRVGQYGATAAFEEIEFILDESKFKNNPQGFELVNAIDDTKIDFIIRQTSNDIYLKPLGYNNSPWPLKQIDNPYLRTPGYVRADEVLYTINSIENITDVDASGNPLYPVSSFVDGTYIWCGFEGRGWNVYRFTDAPYKILDATYSNSTLTIKTDKQVRLPVGTWVAFDQVTGFSGFYKIKKVTLDSFTVSATLKTPPGNPFAEQSTALMAYLSSQRVESIDSANLILTRRLNNNEKLWTDKTSTANSWAVWEYSPVYARKQINDPTPTADGKFGRSISVSKDGLFAIVSTANKVVITYDKVPGTSLWLQRQSVFIPFIHRIADQNLQQDGFFAEITSISPDSSWVAFGSPNTSAAASAYVGVFDVGTGYTLGNIVVDDSTLTAWEAKKAVPAGSMLTDTQYWKQLNYISTSITGSSSGLLAQGAVSLYQKDTSNTIALIATVVSPLPTQNEYFGSNLLFGNNNLFVTAKGAGSSGRIYQYTYTSGLGWVFASVIECPGLVSGAEFGYSMSISTDGTLAVSAPGINTVFIYSADDYTVPAKTLTLPVNLSVEDSPRYGEAVAISDSGTYLAVGIQQFDLTKIDQGEVRVYDLSVTTLLVDSPYQTLLSPRPEASEYFGSKVAFMNNEETIVIFSPNGDSLLETTFNIDGITTFDNRTLRLFETDIDSGRVDVFDRYINNWVYSESIDPGTDPVTGEFLISSNDKFGSGFAVANNSIIIGAPGNTSNNVRSGKVYSYIKPVNTLSWEVIQEAVQKPDLSKIKKAFLYNKKTNKLVSYLDVIDPAQGKIPGVADQYLKYKTFFDPAVYSVGTTDVTVDDGQSWTDSQVGTLWWDLRPAKFIDSYGGDVVYRNSTWNTLFPTATIDIYEWVKTKYLPAEWDKIADTEAGLTNGISGKSLYGNTVYSVKKRYDSISQSFKNTYYYWVKNKKTIPSIGDRSLSASDISLLIANPKGQDYKYIALTSANSFSIVNAQSLLNDKDVVLSVQYWTTEQTDQNIHSEWRLISEDTNSFLPKHIEEKWFDSLCGKDSNERVVPDLDLPPKLRYGVMSRPRQSMFVNRFEALKQLIERANTTLLETLIVNNKDISDLNSYDLEPSVVTGLYDFVVDTDAELRFSNVSAVKLAVITPIVSNNGYITGITIINPGNGYINAPYITVRGNGTGASLKAIINAKGQITGATVISKGQGYDSYTTVEIRNYSVLVHSDNQALGRWSIYAYDPTLKIWERSRSQAYDVRKYWSYADWYATGFNQFTLADFSVDTISAISTINVSINQLVKVRTSGSGGWILLKKYADSESIDWTQSYTVVGTESGTIQLSNELYKFANTTLGYDGSLFDGDTFDNTAVKELRIILDSLKNKIFIDDLRQIYLDLFFTCLRYAFAEQTYLDWAFKTSFVRAQHNVGALKQKTTYNNDNLADFEAYIEEVKPYRTKIREYVSSYTGVDTSELSVTDFDILPVKENGQYAQMTLSVVDGQVNATHPEILSYPWKHWLDNVGFEITELVLTDSGSGYITPPVVRFQGGYGSGAEAKAFIANGKVNRILLVSPGEKFYSAPTVILDGGVGVDGTSAKAIAKIGNSVVRSSLIKMKFDRVSRTYFVTELTENETFTGTGNKTQFLLKWGPDVRIGKSTVTVDGVDILRDSYVLTIAKNTTRGYTAYYGTITFDTPPAKSSIIKVSYIKDWSLLNAPDRIQYYYNPTTGQVGKDLSQLMTGVDYGGTIITGLDFNVSSGWDSLPYFSDGWDSIDPTFDDYIIRAGLNANVFELPYIPEAGVEINIYHNSTRIDDLNYGTSEPVVNLNATMQTFVGDGINSTITLPSISVTKPTSAIVNNNTNVITLPVVDDIQVGSLLLSPDVIPTGTSVVAVTSNLVAITQTGSISGTTLTMSGLTDSYIGMLVTGAGVQPNTYITSVDLAIIAQAEVQKIDVSGVATDQVSFLGQPVLYSAEDDMASDTVIKIAADRDAIIETWNTANPDKQIANIEIDFTNQDAGGNLSGVGADAETGQFSCLYTRIVIGQPIMVVGNLTGTATIDGYVNPTVYYVVDTNGTTTFTISAIVGGSPVSTTAGTTSGLTFTKLAINSTTLKITYADNAGDVPVISSATSNGITFSESTSLNIGVEGAISTAQVTVSQTVASTSLVFRPVVELSNSTLSAIADGKEIYFGLEPQFTYGIQPKGTDKLIMSSVFGIHIGDILTTSVPFLTTSGIPVNTTVTAIDIVASTVTLSNNVTASIPVGTELTFGYNRLYFRKSTSDGSIKPLETDYDTALSGGAFEGTALTSASGLAADDIILDGDDFITPTTSPATEEVVPGQITDAVAIKVFYRPTSGSANIKVDNYRADGETLTFGISQYPNSNQAIIVKLNHQVLNPSEFTLDYRNKTVTLNVTPVADDTVSIFSFGFNGDGVLDIDYFVGNGSTYEFITKAPWVDSTTSLIYVDGEPAVCELFKTDQTYDIDSSVGIRFAVPPAQNAVVNYVIVNGSQQTFSVTKSESFIADGDTSLFTTANKIGEKLPLEQNIFVKVNRQILAPANVAYFKLARNKLTYTIDQSIALPYTPDIRNISVFVDGTLLSTGVDYLVDLSVISITITKGVYQTYKGKTLMVSISTDQQYTATTNSVSFINKPSDGSVVEIITAYNHDILDIQRAGYTINSTLDYTPDTPEYYTYTGLSNGYFELGRSVISSEYVFVIKNKNLLTPAIDYVLNSDNQSITLAETPDVNDKYEVMTYSGNIHKSTVSYMQFKDILNRTHFKRLSLRKQAKLTQTLHYTDTVIHVDDASNFDIPNRDQNHPGIIEVNGERIEYFIKDGNTLRQLRRGTLGTGVRPVNTVGTVVQDIGPSETIPYKDTNIITQVKSAGTNIVPLNYVPTKDTVVWQFANGFVSSIPSGYGQSNDVEVFVGGYNTDSIWLPNTEYQVNDIVNVGSYTFRAIVKHRGSSTFSSTVTTLDSQGADIESGVASASVWKFFIGNIRLKKHPFSAHNVNIHPESTEGDVQLDPDFSVDGTSKSLRLTHTLDEGTNVTVVKKVGTMWNEINFVPQASSFDSNTFTIDNGYTTFDNKNATLLQNSNKVISEFLKATPGAWYTHNAKYGNETVITSSTFDSSSSTFDGSNSTFDQG